LLAPLAMYAAFPRSDYYGASVPSQVLGRRRTLPSTGLDARSDRRPGSVPTFTMRPIDEWGAQLFPDSIATATPQAFTVASPPGKPSRLRSWPPPSSCG